MTPVLPLHAAAPIARHLLCLRHDISDETLSSLLRAVCKADATSRGRRRAFVSERGAGAGRLELGEGPAGRAFRDSRR
jgi:hypothetical protein